MRWLCLVVLCSGCDLVFLEPSSIEDCPDTYVALDGEATRYRFSGTEIRNWTSAQGVCAGDSTLGITHLAVLDTTHELAAIRAQVPANIKLVVGFARNIDDDPKQFTAVTGEALAPDSPFWRSSSEPNNDGGAEVATELEAGGLNDIAADSANPYVCECDAKMTTRMFRFQ